MLHIWGRLSSINVRKVVWAAQEVGVAFERTDAGASFGVVNTPQYLQMNPNAMVPVLQDGAQFSMADIPVAGELHRWFGLPQARLPHCHIERWYQTLRARQASQGVLDLVLS